MQIMNIEETDKETIELHNKLKEIGKEFIKEIDKFLDARSLELNEKLNLKLTCFVYALLILIDTSIVDGALQTRLKIADGINDGLKQGLLHFHLDRKS